MAVEIAKQAAARQAVSAVRDKMVVGLGTGSTANFAIELLGEMVRKGLDIRGVPTSRATERLARQLKIPLLTEFSRVDLTIDGADEVDRQGNLIKGGGGALTREKIVAAATDHQIIIIDESKLVEKLGRFPLPVEVLPFGWKYVRGRILGLCRTATLRKTGDEPFLTDNENYILDCQFERIDDPGALASELNGIAGVVENGLFVGLTNRVIVGSRDGKTDVIDF